MQASYYGHAAAGLLHVRPVLDLHSAEDLKKYRQIADEVAALVSQFKGTLAGEHGVGIARTEYLKDQVGDELYQLMREIKQSFDPDNLFNPGKIISDGRYKIDSHLRMGAGYSLKLPFEPLLAFAARDGSFTANLEQCNGCGGCLKQTPTMCPTFIATGEEIMSTRGRANAIRAALELRGIKGDPLRSPELEAALSNCLSCKACTTECPSNVNLALLKAELLHARIRRDGLKLRERLFSSVDQLGRLGLHDAARGQCASGILPGATGSRNRLLGHHDPAPVAAFCADAIRPLVCQTSAVRARDPRPGHPVGRHVHALSRTARSAWPPWRCSKPRVLKSRVPAQRKCCGRPAFSQGNLDEAARLGRHNLALLNADAGGTPIIFLEPSCFSMFVEDYRELKLPDAENVARRCFLFEDFIENFLSWEPDGLTFNNRAGRLIIHAHCHAKALANPNLMRQLAERLPEKTVTLLDTGCCGMAGAFGMLESKYELSVKVAEPLIQKVMNQPLEPPSWLPAPVAASKFNIWPPSGCVTWPKCWPNRWRK